MVSKGLKAGDTFIEGVSAYIVEKVLPNGDYVSRRIGKADAKKEEKPVKRTRTKKNAE